MNRTQLVSAIREKQSFLCVGLDSDVAKLPASLQDSERPVWEFNQRIIEATQDLAVAYKINTAFYEARGLAGWRDLEDTVRAVPAGCLIIADAKRGDIGNTSRMYAEAFLQQMECDAITVAPYMGEDSVTPFLEIPNKWVILLALTSNAGAADFQLIRSESDHYYFEHVVEKAQTWASDEQLMFVVGATRGEVIGQVRKLAPNHFFLVPGVGAQGGSLSEVAQYGMTADCGLLVNASRSILYASQDKAFADASRQEAQRLQQEMKALLHAHNVV